MSYLSLNTDTLNAIRSIGIGLDNVASAINAGVVARSDQRLRQNRIEAAAVLAQLAQAAGPDDYTERNRYSGAAVVLLESAGLSGGAENLP